MFACRRPVAGLALALVWVLCVSVAPAVAEKQVGAAAPDTAETRMRRDVTILASDEFEGRGVTTKGNQKAGDYVALQFQKAGLKPGGKDGSYFQPFPVAGSTLAGPAKLQLTGAGDKLVDLKAGEQFQPLGMAHTGDVTGDLVFAGYGITAAAKDFNYDDYKDLNVEGKVVIVLRDTPDAANRTKPFGGPQRRELASFTRKTQNALKHKAAGILFVSDRDTAKGGDDLLDFTFTATAPSPAKLPAFHVRRKVVDALLKSSVNTGLEDLERAIDSDLKPRSAVLKGCSAHLTMNVKRDGIPARNVIGVLEGKGPLADEIVVIGAHYDHLGFGGPGSLAGLKKQAIHHGADDNGSGTTAVLELARRFGAMKDRQGRKLVFMTFSGEELGLLGSAYYVKNPLFPLDKTVAMVNLDMVGRLRNDNRSSGWGHVLSMLTPPAKPLSMPQLTQAVRGMTPADLEPGDRLIVYGTGTAKTFDALIDDVNRKYAFRLKKNATGMGPSDQQSFYLKKIPVFFFFTGEHPDYHRPTDTADKINVAGMTRIVDLVVDLVGKVAQAPQRPEYVAVKTSGGGGGRPGNIPRLGIRPGDYDEETNGLKVGDVVPDGPAARAGVKAGDRIVSIGGKPVKDIRTYMSALGAHKVGQPLELGIIRAGKEIKIKATPE